MYPGFADRLVPLASNPAQIAGWIRSGYDPSPHLGKITAPLLAVNFADDFINPPDLGLMRSGIGRVKRGRLVEKSWQNTARATKERGRIFSK
jgi:hypothetical protein